MKYIYYAVIFCSLGMVSCNQTTSEFVVLCDDSDADIQKPNIKLIIEKYHHNSYDGIHLQLETISDRLVSEQYEFRLKPRDFLLIHGDNRQEEFSVFTHSVQKRVDSIYSKNDEKPKSQIVKKVDDKVKYLNQSDSSDKLLFVYSNLEENSIFSTYDLKNRELLMRNPEKVAQYFRDMGLGLEEHSVKIVLVNSSADYENDRLFMKWVEVYQHLYGRNHIEILSNL